VASLGGVFGGAAGYVGRKLAGGGLDDDRGLTWDRYATRLPSLAGGNRGGSSMPSLAGGLWGSSGMPSLAGGGGGWGGMPSLAGGNSYLSDLGRQAQQAGYAMQAKWTQATAPRNTTPNGSSGGTFGGNTGYAGAGGWLATQAPGHSPLLGIADEAAAYAVSKNVDPGVLFGLLQKESSWATNGMGPGMNNPGNIMAPGADPANGKIVLRSYPTMLDGVKAIVDLLASYEQAYGATSLEAKIATYYVGPEAYKRYGLQANDAGGQGPGGNGTVQDYLDRFIYPMVQSYNNRPGAIAPATNGGALASIWGNTNARDSQAFGVVTPGIDQSIYAYGRDYGLSGGHTGLDVAMPRGSALYMPQGFNGVVTLAGGSGVFRDEDYDGGKSLPGVGELRIALDNGDILILGHTSKINVQRGQRITGGMLVALAGSAGGDHLHLEVRRKNPNGTYTLVDPRTYFAQQGAPPVR
jgi:murein DD-endopeptidase MepM/ murein hydrolase activator NlpD